MTATNDDALAINSARIQWVFPVVLSADPNRETRTDEPGGCQWDPMVTMEGTESEEGVPAPTSFGWLKSWLRTYHPKNQPEGASIATLGWTEERHPDIALTLLRNQPWGWLTCGIDCAEDVGDVQALRKLAVRIEDDILDAQDRLVQLHSAAYPIDIAVTLEAPPRTARYRSPSFTEGTKLRPFFFLRAEPTSLNDLACEGRIAETLFTVVAMTRTNEASPRHGNPDSLKLVRDFALGPTWACLFHERSLLCLAQSELPPSTQQLREWAEQAVAASYGLAGLLHHVSHSLNLYALDLWQMTSTTGTLEREHVADCLGRLSDLREHYAFALMDPATFAYPGGSVHALQREARTAFRIPESKKLLAEKFIEMDRLLEDNLQLRGLARG